MRRASQILTYIAGRSEIAGKVRPFRQSQIALTIVALLCVTMLLTIVAASLEWAYLWANNFFTPIEWYALLFVQAGFVGVLGFLIIFGGTYLYEISTAVCAGGSIYVLTMIVAGLFYGGDPERVTHTATWFHAIFIVTTLTQQPRHAQLVCWTLIARFGALILSYGMRLPAPWVHSSLMIELAQLLLSLCASALLLYGLSVFRQMQGADHARVELLQETAVMLRAQALEKENARAELERSNAVITRFLDNMSHELRTPLNAVIGFSELIRDELFGAHANQKYKEYANDILGSGQQLLAMVNNLLFFSKLSAGKITLDTVDLDAKAVLDDAANLQKENAARFNVEIINDTAGKPVLVADANGISRLLFGLLDNAIKFSRPGGKIFMRAQHRPDGACEITIRDTGMGIPKTELADIFIAFRKGKLSETNATPGTGMGLAMAKMLVDLHGGLISIASVEGEGTTVTLVFPVNSKQ